MISSELIQAFLSVVEYGNITAAANNTFTTQSHLSKQIRLLEEQIGSELLIRQKGRSGVALTPAGKEFLETARKWRRVMKEFDDVSSANNITEVSIGALDRLNTFALRDVYRSILKEHMDIRLDCHTRHSKEIYAMMEAQQLDLGIVSALYPVFNIRAQTIGTESMYLICHPDNSYGKIVKPEELRPEDEIYSRWSDEFEIWHDQIWPDRKYRCHVGTSAQAPAYLNEPGRWYIVPSSALHGLKENYRFSVHRLSVHYPVGKLYLLEQKHPRMNRGEATETVKKELLTAFFGKTDQTVK